ncbi:MAG: hypothetical protein ABUS49_09980 [Acidobacteriota bacterium]
MAIAAALGAAVFDSQSVWRKLESIERGRTGGSRVVFTSAELNAWVGDQTRALAPQGARNPRLELGSGLATGYADIDFLKLRQAATGEAPGWLMKNLFSGVRPVKVIARIQSRNGRARVDVARVEVSGIAIEGPALDFLIEDFVRPLFPNAIVSEWFELQHGVDHFTVNTTGIAVFMRR